MPTSRARAPTTAVAPRAAAVRPLVLTGPARALAPRVGVALKNPAGELGYLGALGPNGPLGANGPIGGPGSPSHLITGSFDWSSWANLMTAWGGPLSLFGPLGANGPLNRATTEATLKALQVGGDEAVLGPAGPLGALGPLGPLGPAGAHGYRATAAGDYVDAKGKPVRTLEVSWDLTRVNTEELVEDYTEARAKKLKTNDTSFMVEGKAKAVGETDRYAFHSRADQYVTVLVVPTRGQAVSDTPASASMEDLAKNFDDFDLTVTDGAGQVLGTSRLRDGSDWVQLKVPAGADLRAEVTLRGSPHTGAKPYRLVVVGTGDHTADLSPGQAWSPVTH